MAQFASKLQQFNSTFDAMLQQLDSSSDVKLAHFETRLLLRMAGLGAVGIGILFSLLKFAG